MKPSAFNLEIEALPTGTLALRSTPVSGFKIVAAGTAGVMLAGCAAFLMVNRGAADEATHPF